MTLPPMEIFHDIEQGTQEWLDIRAGVITASAAECLLTDGKRPDGLGAGALTYGYELAGELLINRPAPIFSTANTERGHEREPVLRAEYEFISGNEIEEVGFMRRGRLGYSPDGMIKGQPGIIEIKDRLPKIALPVMAGGPLSKAEVAQAQFGMMISGAQYRDFIVGCEGHPTMIRRLEPDPEMQATMLERVEALLAFVDDIVQRVRM